MTARDIIGKRGAAGLEFMLQNLNSKYAIPSPVQHRLPLNRNPVFRQRSRCPTGAPAMPRLKQHIDHPSGQF